MFNSRQTSRKSEACTVLSPPIFLNRFPKANSGPQQPRFSDRPNPECILFPLRTSLFFPPLSFVQFLTIVSHSLLRFFSKMQNLYLLFIYLWNLSTAERYVYFSFSPLFKSNLILREVYLSIWCFSLSVHCGKDIFLSKSYQREKNRLDCLETNKFDIQTKKFLKAKWKDLTVLYYFSLIKIK